MKKKTLAFAICAIFSAFALTACSPSATEINLPELEKPALDGSVAPLYGAESAEMLGNIDRGYRMEVYLHVGDGTTQPYANTDYIKFFDDEAEKYAPEGVNEAQVYIYMTAYNEKPLDDLALNQIKIYLEHVREKRFGILLRFAYEFDQTNLVGPEQEMLLTHLSQLKKFMRDNVDLVNDVVTAYQFGCIGAWGEWGATGQKYDEKKVLDALLDMMPEGTYYQGRYLRVTDQTKKNPKNDFVGYHNDYMVAKPHPWNTAGDKYETKAYRAFFETSKLRVNDGEMPWSSDPTGDLEGKKMIQQCTEFSLATLSLTHNSQFDTSLKEGGAQNFKNWQSEVVTAEDLDALHCPYYDAYFRDRDGNGVSRSVYEYLRDFLGYVLMLSDLEISGGTVSFQLANFGMGAPLTVDRMEFVVLDADGVERVIYVPSFDPKKLTTYGRQSFTVDAGDLAGKRFGVRLVRLASSGNYHIRTANSVGFERGVNLI